MKFDKKIALGLVIDVGSKELPELKKRLTDVAVSVYGTVFVAGQSNYLPRTQGEGVAAINTYKFRPALSVRAALALAVNAVRSDEDAEPHVVLVTSRDRSKEFERAKGLAGLRGWGCRFLCVAPGQAREEILSFCGAE